MRNQQRFAWRRLHEVGVVRGQHRLLSVERGVRAIARRPCTRALALPGIGVEIPVADVLSRRLVGHFPNADIRMEDGDRAGGDGCEVEAEQLARNEEHRLAQLVELQVGLHLFAIERVLRLANFLRIVAIVPRLDGDVGALGLRQRLHVGDFFLRANDSRAPDGFHQRGRGGGVRRHVVLQLPVGIGRKAQQVHPLVPQLQDLRDHRVVVMLVAIVAARIVIAPDLLP